MHNNKWPPKPKVQTQLSQLVKDVKACRSAILKSVKKISLQAANPGTRNLKKLTTDENVSINELFKKLEQRAYSLENSVESNNYLLEFKRKDLLVQTDSLQDALDEISVRNKELQAQKIQISEQAEKLKLSHREILEKNNELEQKTESLLDQADYLA